jgi:3-dehydroquinate synthetase
MVAAARLSRERFDRDLTGLHEDLIAAAGLPLRVPNVETGRALQAMGRDKKRSGSDAAGEHRFVLLEDVGRPVRGVPVKENEALRAIEAVVE